MGKIKLTQEGKTILQFKGKQTSEISSKTCHKLSTVHLQAVPLCALAVTQVLEGMGSVVLGHPPGHPLSPSPAVQAHREGLETSLQVRWCFHTIIILNSQDQTLL